MMKEIPQNKLRYGLSWVAWPGLFTMCMVITAYGFAGPHPIVMFNVAYFLLAACLLVLEFKMPFEPKWLPSDGQTFANIAHTLTSKGTVQGLIFFSGAIGLADLITSVEQPGYSIWPRDWPMAVQVAIGVVVAEFGLYWAHRLAHIWSFLWRFHAIHHSVTKLWIINTGRFHFIDSLVSIVLGMVILVALGAPMEVVQWQAVITAFIGMLTHCNVEMRFGPLSWVFNTPGLHRWHHSRNLDEGNRNFSENIMLWDQLFGTYINPDRRPPADIGIAEYMPPRFVHQLAWPFLTDKQRKKIENGKAVPQAAE